MCVSGTVLGVVTGTWGQGRRERELTISWFNNGLLSVSRVQKSAEEMEIMRYVNEKSCEAHKEVMKMMRPGRMEYEGEA